MRSDVSLINPSLVQGMDFITFLRLLLEKIPNENCCGFFCLIVFKLKLKKKGGEGGKEKEARRGRTAYKKPSACAEESGDF